MKHILCLLYSLFVLTAISFAQSNKTESAVLARIAALPEVKYFMKTAKKSKPTLIIASRPTVDRKFYWVKVGINNFDMFRTTDNYFVDPKTFQIFYADLFAEETEQLLTLKQWRKWRKLPVWKEWHCYKYQGKKLVIYTCKP